jgi:hypothetical protein
VCCLLLLAGCSETTRSADTLVGWTDRLRARQVLIWLDLSASMSRASIARDLERLSRELLPTDRVMVLGITGRSAADLAPAVDTVLPGSLLDRWAAGIGLSTARSRAASQLATRELAQLLEGAWAALAADHGRTAQTAIVAAVCESNRLAQESARPTWALLLTDGVEESPLVNLARSVPEPTQATRVATRLSARGDCPPAPRHVRVRLVGVRHRTQTPALVTWWRTLLRTLGARLDPGDVALYRAQPLLSARNRPVRALSPLFAHGRGDLS